MKIVVDINHPAHVHYFKNFIWEMEKQGHEILVTASEKDVSYKLLTAYKIPFLKLGNYGHSIQEKMINIPIMDYRMYKGVKDFNPDVFLGFGSIRNAHVSKLLNKLCINLDDSEPSPQEHLLYVPFSDIILTPHCFRKDFGNKHIRFNSYIEMAYLHPNWFKPDPAVLKNLGIEQNEKYILMRFVSWGASHDIFRKGIRNKEKIIKEMEKYCNVYVSSEKKLNGKLEKYQLSIRPEQLHNLLYYSNMFICDGQTMATESAILGIPTIRCNSFVGSNDMGNFIELENKYGLIYNYNNLNDAISKSINLIADCDLKEKWKKKQNVLLNDKIDMTAFLIEYVYHCYQNLRPD